MSGQVYAVASGKGGVGKTTTVVNLGVALRAAGRSVVLVDADLGMANLATLLGIDHEPTLHDVLANDASLEDAVLEEAEGFGVLPGTRALTGFAEARPERLQDVIEALAERFEYVLVDSGAGLSYEDVLPLALADRVILVTSPDPAAVGDTRKTVELAGLVDAPIRGVVVTFVNDSVDPPGIAEGLGTELLAAVPEDPAVPASAQASEPLAAHAPDGPAAEAYRGLAGILDEDDVADDSSRELPDSSAVPGTPGAATPDDAAAGGENETDGGRAIGAAADEVIEEAESTDAEDDATGTDDAGQPADDPAAGGPSRAEATDSPVDEAATGDEPAATSDEADDAVDADESAHADAAGDADASAETPGPGESDEPAGDGDREESVDRAADDADGNEEPDAPASPESGGGFISRLSGLFR